MSAANRHQGGDLEIIEERTMFEAPRGKEGREVLRVRFVRARTGQGAIVCWHDLREFFRDDQDQWRPGRKGITVRGGELRGVADALAKASSGGAPPAQHAQSTQRRTMGTPAAQTDFGDEDGGRGGY
jgi:Transcriptional Coactivator p15 (PC4)